MGLMRERNPDFVANRFTLGTPHIVYTGLSENITRDVREQIRETLLEMTRSGEYSGILMSHGTDSLEETARDFLNRDEELGNELTFRGMKITVVAAEHDPDHPQTDAFDNLELGINTLLDTDLKPGIYVPFHHRVIPASRVSKKPYAGMPGFDFLDDKSPEYSQAGVASFMWRHGVNLKLRRALEKEFGYENLWEQGPQWKGRGGVRSYVAGMARENHDIFFYSDAPPMHALILELYHSGTANTLKGSGSILEFVKRVRKEQPQAVIFARTENHEPVDLHAYETSVMLRQNGVVPLYTIPYEAARTKAGWAVRQTKNPRGIIDLVLTDIAGEIDPSVVDWDDVAALKEQYA
jgi:L-asparaginase/Glu-tRNA(Gln) amidotransferase subunit D